MIHTNDMQELQRMVTNLYDPEKSCIVRVLRGITDLQREVTKLKLEIKTLKKEE